MNTIGDTIVEVLIAIAVIGSVLGAAYATMNRNMLVLRDNQERTEATKLAQGQVEILKMAWQNAVLRDEIEDEGGGGFCLQADGSVVGLGHGIPHSDIEDDDFTDYKTECQSSYYNKAIRRLSARTYKVYVRYDQLGRDSKSEASIVYILP